MPTHPLTFGNLTIENPTPDLEAQFNKLNAVKAEVLAEPAVREAVAGLRDIMPVQRRFEAEHGDGKVSSESPAFLGAAAKLIRVMGESLRRHGIEDAPTNFEESSHPTPKGVIPDLFEASVIEEVSKSADASEPHSPPTTPKKTRPSLLDLRLSASNSLV